MKTIKLLLACIITFTCQSLMAQAQISKSLKLVIIRHGEKDPTGDNLNCMGLNRALQLPKIMVARFGVPSQVYVPSVNSGKATTHARMLQTATPLAAKYNLTINSKYDVDDVEKLSRNLEAQKGTIFVIWEHNTIVDILKSLGIKTKGMEWPDSDFDSIWIVTYASGKAVLSKATEGLKPNNNCRF